MEYRKQAKAAMNKKISKMISADTGKVDASSWTPPEPLNADVKTGMRPISRRQFKRGGKVDAKVEGKAHKGRADRKPRKDGGKALTADSLINRDLKEANQARDGVKHVGGMKSGGRAKKYWGGSLPYGSGMEGVPQGQGSGLMRKVVSGGYLKNGGKVRSNKASGGAPGAPAGRPTSRPADPPPAPVAGSGMPGGGMPGSPNPPGLANGLPMKNPVMGGMMPPGLGGAMPNATGMPGSAPAYKKGGKVKGRKAKQDGGANAPSDSFLQDYYKNTMTGRMLDKGVKAVTGKSANDYLTAREARKIMKGEDPYEDRGGVEYLPEQPDPYEDRPNVEGMDKPMYRKGGKVDHSAHTAIGHAVGAAMRAYHDHEAAETPAHEAAEERAARKSGGRIGKAMGGGFGEDMNNPKSKPSKSSKGSKTPVINITINSEPKPMLPPVAGGPMPLGAPPMPPGMAPGMGPAPGAAPPMPAGLPPGLAGMLGGGGAGPGAGGPAPMPRKSGGRAMTAGAGSGEGRLEKADWYGARPARAAGGKLGMTAGAGSGEGRKQKIDAYGKKA